MTKELVDINCDMAELDAIDDMAFMPFISSCNVCCGEHAGHPEKILRTIRAAIEAHLKIGAHPSYPDRLNFGRKSMDIHPDELYESLFQQIRYIKNIVEWEGGVLNHIKPHGALYNDLVHRPDVLDVFLDVVSVIDKDVKLFLLAHSSLTDKVRDRGFKIVAEGFMDRKYTKEGLLASRSLSGNVFENLNQVKAQLDLLLQQKIKTELGDIYDLPHDTICLHSDTPQAIEWMPQILKFIKSRGFEIA